MKKNAFLWQLSGLTVFLVALTIVLQQIHPILVYDYTFYFIIYFFFLSLINHQFIKFALKNKESDITSYYYLSMIIRFFLSIIVVFIVIYSDKENKISAAANFMVLYFVFLVFEIVSWVRDLTGNMNSK